LQYSDFHRRKSSRAESNRNEFAAEEAGPENEFVRQMSHIGLFIAPTMSTKGDKAQSKELTVVNKLGIHARPAALFVKTANRFACDITVEKDGEKVNGKSIMGMMMLAAGPGSRLMVHADGQDAIRALNELDELLKRKFDED
jgi:phosphocarrier protein HPr